MSGQASAVAIPTDDPMANAAVPAPPAHVFTVAQLQSALVPIGQLPKGFTQVNSESDQGLDEVVDWAQQSCPDISSRNDLEKDGEQAFAALTFTAQPGTGVQYLVERLLQFDTAAHADAYVAAMGSAYARCHRMGGTGDSSDSVELQRVTSTSTGDVAGRHALTAAFAYTDQAGADIQQVVSYGVVVVSTELVGEQGAPVPAAPSNTALSVQLMKNLATLQ